MNISNIYAHYSFRYHLYCIFYQHHHYNDFHDNHFKSLIDDVNTLPVMNIQYILKMNDIMLGHYVPRKPYENLTLQETDSRYSTKVFYPMVKTIFQTQKFKAELLSKTVPKFDPYRSHMQDILGVSDLSHISIRGLKYIEKQFTSILNISRSVILSGQYMETIKEFTQRFNSIERNSRIKEELMAKVYHPNRMDKWVHYL